MARVLQRQSFCMDWSALQQSALGLPWAPGTTNGAHTFRVFNWLGQLCDMLRWVCAATAMNKRSIAACELIEARHLIAAISIDQFCVYSLLCFKFKTFYFNL